MTLENQVCTLKQAIKLKELGVEQLSLFCYMAYGNEFKDSEKPFFNNFFKADDRFFLWVSAFTVAELGAMLPQGTRCRKCDVIWECEIADEAWEESFGQICTGETEAEGRAALLIYLLEKKL
jgi:hypothetical protein